MKALVTGGAGFIGWHFCRRLLERGATVVILDNFSRHPHQYEQASSLDSLSGNLTILRGDVRDWNLVSRLIESHEFNVIAHMAAQTAVTTSTLNPREDFETNVLGTFNLLEALRASRQRPVFLNASTNKVYGSLSDVPVHEGHHRYEFAELPRGIDESQPLSFHSPYGCSKGAADQYTMDYYRIFGIPTVTFRQSCIYGTHQFGVEDQGWVAWFSIAALKCHPITIYGDGKQVRDLLWVDDLVDLYERAIENIDKCAGYAFNVGGGPKNSVSLLEVTDLLTEISGQRLDINFDDWRPGDQRIFTSNTTLARRILGWEPSTSPSDGIDLLYEWMVANRSLFK